MDIGKNCFEFIIEFGLFFILNLSCFVNTIFYIVRFLDSRARVSRINILYFKALQFGKQFLIQGNHNVRESRGFKSTSTYGPVGTSIQVHSQDSYV
jgi:hypothetical protein